MREDSRLCPTFLACMVGGERRGSPQLAGRGHLYWHCIGYTTLRITKVFPVVHLIGCVCTHLLSPDFPCRLLVSCSFKNQAFVCPHLTGVTDHVSIRISIQYCSTVKWPCFKPPTRYSLLLCSRRSPASERRHRLEQRMIIFNEDELELPRRCRNIPS